jgi:hypothetical protein
VKRPDPRHFQLLRPEDFTALPNMRAGHPRDLIVPMLQRFPIQPPWPAQHPAYTPKPSFHQGRPMPFEMMQTDAEFHRRALALARDDDEDLREFKRFLSEHEAAARQALKVVTDALNSQGLFTSKARHASLRQMMVAAMSRLKDHDAFAQIAHFEEGERDVVRETREEYIKRQWQGSATKIPHARHSAIEIQRMLQSPHQVALLRTALAETQAIPLDLKPETAIDLTLPGARPMMRKG